MKVKRYYDIERNVGKLNIHSLDMLVWHILKFYLNKRLPSYYQKSEIILGKSCRDFVDNEVIVSLTSFPARMDKIYITLESLFRQTIRPDRIILWLADEQYPDKKAVEMRLKKYKKLGLEIQYCDDLRSHKKYFYTMKKYPEAIVITADDDIIYSEDMLEKLLKTYLKYPGKIVCNRAHLMTEFNGKLLPYNSWIYRAKGYTGINIMFCPTGCAGVLYPPHSLSEHVFDSDVIRELCLFADDIWLKCMSYLKGTEVVLTEKDNPETIDIAGANKTGLAQLNVGQDLNDKQIKAVSDYYNIEWNKKLDLKEVP